MSNRAYVSGRSFEYRVKHHLEQLGWFVIRSAGSHSPVDLVAFYPGRRSAPKAPRGPNFTLFVQCKHSSNPAISVKERKFMVRATIRFRVLCTFAFVDSAGRLRFHTVGGTDFDPNPEYL